MPDLDQHPCGMFSSDPAKACVPLSMWLEADVRVELMTMERDAWRREAVKNRELLDMFHRVLFRPPLVRLVNKLLAEEQR